MNGSIGAYEAKTHLSALLDRVERGESLTITRNGAPVARLVPAGAGSPAVSPAEVTAAFRAFRDSLRARGVEPFTLAEIQELRDAGRRG
jgi:prevent-host-death family protein